MEKSWKINVEKRGHPVSKSSLYKTELLHSIIVYCLSSQCGLKLSFSLRY